MADKSGSPRKAGYCTAVAVAGAVGIDKHSAVENAHAEQFSEPQREPGRWPSAIIVKVDLRTRLVPQTRVVRESEGNIDSSPWQAHDRRGELKVATAGASVQRSAGRITHPVSRIVRCRVVAVVPARLRLNHWRDVFVFNLPARR